MRWINARTVFPEPLTLGITTLRRINPANPFNENKFAIKRDLLAEDYLAAKRVVFYETEQVLDTLSIVSQRGFKILKIVPSDTKTKKISLRESLIARSIKQLRSEPTPIYQATTDENGKATLKLQPYREYTLELNLAGFLKEYVTFTHDTQENQLPIINYFSMTINDFVNRISEANANYPRISSLGNITTALRFYRMSLQLNDYITRFVMLWTALESACNLPEYCRRKEKRKLMSDEIVKLPSVKNLKKANEIFEKLYDKRNNIIHNPQITRQKDFAESLPASYNELDWLLINYLLLKLGLKMLHENASPL